MSTTARAVPFIWPTWITGLLSGDDQCQWSAWFKAHFKHEAVERDDASLTQWKADHAAMVDALARELVADGWTVYLEAQNKFFIHGRVATLAGAPDIVALRGNTARVIDCKSGQRRDKDFWQVCIYLMVLPKTKHPAAAVPLVGELQYRDQVVFIQPEQVDTDRIVAQIQRTGGQERPARTASVRECQFCNIGPNDCPERMTAALHEQEVACDLF